MRNERTKGPAVCGACGQRGGGVMELFTVVGTQDGGATKTAQGLCPGCCVPVLRVLMNAGLDGRTADDALDWQMLLTAPARGDGGDTVPEHVRFRCRTCGLSGIEPGDLAPGSGEEGGGLVHRVSEESGTAESSCCGPCVPVLPADDLTPPRGDDAVWACTSCGEANVTRTWPYDEDDPRRCGDLPYHYQPEETGSCEPCGPCIPQGSSRRPAWYRRMLLERCGGYTRDAHLAHCAAERRARGREAVRS